MTGRRRPIQWSEAFATGIPRLDDQHRWLFTMTADFRAALDEDRGERVFGTLLATLQGYAAAHFRFEEGCMAQCRCPAAAANQEAHAKFVVVLASFQARFEARGFDPTDARRLVDTLDDWLARHIGRIDVQIREWVTPA